MSLEAKLAQIQSLTTPVRILTIDLSVAIADREFNVVGDTIGAWLAPAATDEITVRFNDRSADAIPFRPGLALETPFRRLYITCPGTGAGNFYLVYGDAAVVKMIVNNSDVGGAWAAILAALVTANAHLTDIEDELEGGSADGTFPAEQTVGMAAANVLAANVARHGFSVQAKSTNAGIVYVGFTNLVTTTRWWAELQAGQSCGLGDYRGNVWAYGSAAGQIVGVGEW